jgi:hypothetical protein
MQADLFALQGNEIAADLRVIPQAATDRMAVLLAVAGHGYFIEMAQRDPTPYLEQAEALVYSATLSWKVEQGASDVHEKHYSEKAA